MGSLNLIPVVDEGLGNNVALLEPAEMLEWLLTGSAVPDNRQTGEYAAGHVPGAVNNELGYLAENLSSVPEGPVVLLCGRGERAMGGASILAGSGRTGIAVFNGGPDECAAAAGGTLGTDLTAAK